MHAYSNERTGLPSRWWKRARHFRVWIINPEQHPLIALVTTSADSRVTLFKLSIYWTATHMARFNVQAGQHVSCSHASLAFARQVPVQPAVRGRQLNSSNVGTGRSFWIL